MEAYNRVIKLWQSYNIKSVADLDRYLDNFRILFAYHSGKIENSDITYQDTREIFINSSVSNYTGNPRALYEEDKRLYYECLGKYDESEEIAPFIKFLKYEIEKTWGKSLAISEGIETKLKGLNDYA